MKTPLFIFSNIFNLQEHVDKDLCQLPQLHSANKETEETGHGLQGKLFSLQYSWHILQAA